MMSILRTRSVSKLNPAFLATHFPPPPRYLIYFLLKTLYDSVCSNRKPKNNHVHAVAFLIISGKWGKWNDYQVDWRAPVTAFHPLVAGPTPFRHNTTNQNVILPKHSPISSKIRYKLSPTMTVDLYLRNQKLFQQLGRNVELSQIVVVYEQRH